MKRFLLASAPGTFFTYADFLTLTWCFCEMIKLMLFMLFPPHPFTHHLFTYKILRTPVHLSHRFCTNELYKYFEKSLFSSNFKFTRECSIPKPQFGFNYKHNRVQQDRDFFFLKMQQNNLKYMPASLSFSSHSFMQNKFIADKLHFTTTTFTTTTTNAGAFEDIFVFYKVWTSFLLFTRAFFKYF